MANDEPLVSIGMPVRNNERTLGLALRSILNQTYRDWELLLLDDGSTDDSSRIAQRFADSDPRISFIADGRSLGLPERLNQAIAASRGAYFARMDGDDISYPRRLERQIEYLRQHPDVDLVGAGAVVFRGNGTLLGKRPPQEFHEEICARAYTRISIMHPTFLGRIGFFQKFGYRSSAHRCEDQDLLLRGHTDYDSAKNHWTGMMKSQDQDLLLRGCVHARYANVPEILLGYREDQLSLKKILEARYYIAQSFLHVFMQRRKSFTGIQAVIVQALKAMVDIVAITSGLNYRLLRHRARPITESERREWERVWSELTICDSRDASLNESFHEARP